MYELFLDKNNAYTVATVGYHYYYGVFINHFNLTFGYPATDTCSTCQTYKLAMKNQDITDNQKKLKTALFILHRRKARKFYSLLNDIHPNEITICFDMMENLVLPKLLIGEAYYSRQLYFYVLGVVIHKGDKSQSVNDIYFFTWMECENRKDSNMICSAIEHLLKNVLKDKCFNASSLRLFSDACYGQNKNINMTCMLLALRKQYFNKLQITHTFPERGHSYLPADRMFGRVQLDIKKRDQNFEPNEYINILSRHGKVMVYGQNWSAHDFKSEVKKYVMSKKTFKISEAKKLLINSDKLEVVAFSYHSEPKSHSILKKRKKWETFRPQRLELNNCVKLAKKDDVFRLLGLVGAEGRILSMYKTLLCNATEDNASLSEEDSS